MKRDAEQEAARSFSHFRWKWLEQVACDKELPALCSRVAVLLAVALDRETGDAWLGIPKMAKRLGKGLSTIRAALVALDERRHLVITWTAGGNTNTNRYHPTLWMAQPSENLEGSRDRKPTGRKAEIVAQPSENLEGSREVQPSRNVEGWAKANPPALPPSTLQVSTSQPSKNLEGIPVDSGDSSLGGRDVGGDRPPKSRPPPQALRASSKVVREDHQPAEAADSKPARTPDSARPASHPKRETDGVNSYLAAKEGW